MADSVKSLPSLLRIPTDLLDPGDNARGDLGSLVELQVSLAVFGQQQPLLVYPTPDGRYRVLEGHRRLAAARNIGLEHLDAVLRREPTEANRLLLQITLHVQREAFDPLAEARALSTLMFEHGMSREDLARACGKTPGWVRDRLALLNLTDAEQAAVTSGELPMVAARERVVARRTGAPPAVIRASYATRRGEQYFGHRHPLAESASRRCRGAEHPLSSRLAEVACGPCWEATIRADAIAASAPSLQEVA